MADLLEQRRDDLVAQLESLPRELERWEALTQERKFEKHHSQVLALARQMRELNDTVRQAWNNSGDFIAIRKAQRDCAAVQRVWNYYREKLLMRFDEQFGAYLRAADAYVWACYEPVLRERRAANPAEAFREPPLVAFDTEVSPWAQSRRGSATEACNLLDPALDPMPIAVLGVPWSTAAVLPKLAALAHETGHVIESDFGVSDPVETALAEALKHAKLADGWSHYWRKEVFADLFACYAAGPAFVWALADAIPDSPQTVQTKRRPAEISGEGQWGRYPPATLRILLNLFALRTLGHDEAANDIERYWKGAYPTHAMSDFEDDVKLVVPAVYRVAKLPECLNWAKLTTEYRQVASIAPRQTADLDPHVLFDPRTLVAVAADVQRTRPNGVDQSALCARLQKHIVESRPPGVLAGQRERMAAPDAVRLRTAQIATLLFDGRSAEADGDA